MIGAALVALLAVSVAMGQDDKAKGEPGAKKNEAMKPMTGQCHCGHVKYQAQRPVLKCSYCDCRGCQRATGTLKAPFISVRRSAFTIIAGEPSGFRAASGVKCDAHGQWHFCPKCGTQIFWKGHKGNEVDIFAGTLDDTTLFQPKK